MRILLSRTDSLGDVLLTLPIVGLIKKKYPEAAIDFLGTTYSKPVLDYCTHLNQVLLWDDIEKMDIKEAVALVNNHRYDVCIHVFPRKNISFLIKKTNIKMRVGTTGRWYHHLTCNKLVRFSRRRSDLHEAHLNAKLLAPLGIVETPTMQELTKLTGFQHVPVFNGIQSGTIDKNKINVILHPKSKGSAVEWGLSNYNQLIKLLDPERFHVFITGTQADKDLINDDLDLEAKHVTNLMGKLSLHELISFINSVDALVAASTGPLHIAGILNKLAIGLFSPRIPIHPGRWRPLGGKTHVLVYDENCPRCAKGETCACITKINPEKVKDLLVAHCSSVR